MDPRRRKPADKFCAGGFAQPDSAGEFQDQRHARDTGKAHFFRADAREFYDRGNRKTEVTFDTTRAFTDQVSAESFLLMHETQFPGQFNVTFQAGRSGGGPTASRYLANADRARSREFAYGLHHQT